MHYYGDDMRWFVGTVANNLDPQELGRVQVRIYGIHSKAESDLPLADLPWASCVVPTTEGGTSGIGRMPQLQPGAQVVGFFLDGKLSQVPLIVGSIPRIEIPSPAQMDYSQEPRMDIGYGVGQVDPRLAQAAKQQRQSAEMKSITDTSGLHPEYPPDCTPEWITQQIVRECGAPRNIDPRVAVGVAKSEGLYTYQSRNTKGNIRKHNGTEASFGPFQLYVHPKAMGGDYEATTGRTLLTDNTREGILNQIEFALDRAIQARNWDAWFGWVGHPRGSSRNSRTAGFDFNNKTSKTKRY